MRFRTKRIELDAIKYTGEISELEDWARAAVMNSGATLEVETSEGPRSCSPGDYFVRTDAGLLLIRNGPVFESVFEPCDD